MAINYAKKLGYTQFYKIETKESGLADLNDKEGLERLKLFVKDNKEYKTIFATELSHCYRIMVFSEFYYFQIRLLCSL